MPTVFIKDNNTEISSTLIENVQAVEDSRLQIINEINSSFKPYDFSKLTNNIEYTNPNKAQHVNQILNFEKLIPTDTNLADLPQEIQDKIIPWQPVMQIARSASGDGTINSKLGTATTITMYNNEVSSNFFTKTDIGNDENGIPLCYWGYGIASAEPQAQKQNTAPNSPIFNRYSKAENKPGRLFPAPNKTLAPCGTLYYQFTFPYNCYICITIKASTDWNNVEASGEPVAFMINDEIGNNVVARTSYDNGEGYNESGKNRYFSTVYWHGYVKKGWKFYYAEQDWDLGTNAWGKGGHCCVVFKAGNNDALIHSNGYTVSPILSMYRTANGQQHTTAQNGTSINVVMHNNEVSSDYIVADETWLGPDKSDDYDIEHFLPNTPLFNKYSVDGSKGGTLFLSNTDAFALHSTIKVKEDGYLAVSLGGSKYQNAEDYGSTYGGETFALVICKPNSNEIRIAKTSCDDGNGNNINSTFKTSVQFTGKVYKDEKIYFANLDNATFHDSESCRHCSVGMSLTLYKLVKSNDKILEDLYNNTSIKQISLQVNDANIISNENNTVIQTAFNSNTANLAKTYGCIIEQLDSNSIAIITMYLESYDGFYIRTDSNNKILESSYFTHNSNANSNNYQRSLTKVLTCNKNDIIYVSVLTADFCKFTSLTICPIEY